MGVVTPKQNKTKSDVLSHSGTEFFCLFGLFGFFVDKTKKGWSPTKTGYSSGFTTEPRHLRRSEKDWNTTN